VATEPILAQWSGPRTYTLAVTNSLGATATISAPATMPSMTAPATGGTVIIRCESAANPAVYTELTITLYALPTITSFELL
jgi:hypothetical protein